MPVSGLAEDADRNEGKAWKTLMTTTIKTAGNRQEGNSKIAIAKLLNIIIFVNNCHDSFTVRDALKRSANFIFYFFILFLHGLTFWLVPQLSCDMQQIKVDF